MEYYFHNIELAVEAADGKAAYTIICEALAAADIEFTTSTFSSEEVEEELPTALLFPTHPEEEEEEVQS